MRRTLTSATLGAVVIVLVACGGSGSDGVESSPTVSASPTPAPVTASPSATPDCSQAGPPIEVVDVATAEVTVVARGVQPSWSPDGERLAFIGPDEADCEKPWSLHFLDLATGATTLIYDDNSSAFTRWSPDGSYIALVALERLLADGERIIELIDVETGSAMEMFRGRRANGPVWSADGERLAFAGLDNQGTWSARVVDAKTGATVAKIEAEAGRSIGEVGLSPSGDRLAFAAFEEDIKGNRIRNYLYMGPVDGEPLLVFETEKVLAHPLWSFDGAHLAVTAGFYDKPQLYTVRADGSGLQHIADGWAPSWAPNQNLLAFVDDPCGRSDTSIIASDGSGLRVLAPELEGRGLLGPIWSPAGDRIALSIEAGEDSGLHVVERDGGGLKFLTDPPPLVASWSPDGSRLAVAQPAGGRGFCY